MQSPNTSALTGHSQQLKNEFGSSSSSGGAGPIRRHRSSTHDSMQKCQFCPKKYPTIAALRNHMEDCRSIRVHECAQCGKRFKARGGLQQHNRIHLQERPYHCHFCPKRFTQKSHVDQHERIHTGMFWISLPTCEISKALGKSDLCFSQKIFFTKTTKIYHFFTKRLPKFVICSQKITIF